MKSIKYKDRGRPDINIVITLYKYNICITIGLLDYFMDYQSIIDNQNKSYDTLWWFRLKDYDIDVQDLKKFCEKVVKLKAFE